jgi:hypothetical protein
MQTSSGIEGGTLRIAFVPSGDPTLRRAVVGYERSRDGRQSALFVRSIAVGVVGVNPPAGKLPEVRGVTWGR